jgi:hypothetical protein
VKRLRVWWWAVRAHFWWEIQWTCDGIQQTLWHLADKAESWSYSVQERVYPKRRWPGLVGPEKGGPRDPHP